MKLGLCCQDHGMCYIVQVILNLIQMIQEMQPCQKLPRYYFAVNVRIFLEMYVLVYVIGQQAVVFGINSSRIVNRARRILPIYNARTIYPKYHSLPYCYKLIRQAQQLLLSNSNLKNNYCKRLIKLSNCYLATIAMQPYWWYATGHLLLWQYCLSNLTCVQHRIAPHNFSQLNQIFVKL